MILLVRAQNQASNVLRGIGKDVDRLAADVRRAGLAMTAAGGAMAAALGVAVKAAMDAVESENLFEVSMGDGARAARRWSEEMSKALGLNAYEVRRQLGTFNVMFRSMGLSEQGALDMAKGITTLAYDMASFYNLRPEEAFEKLQSAISGEVEPLRRLGILVNETTVQNWALEHGMIKQGEAMSEAAKVVARYNVILEASRQAHGDLARTMESPANQLRRIRAQIDELAIDIGKQFLPVVSKALKWISDEGLPRVVLAVEALRQKWSGMSDEARIKLLAVVALFVAGGPLLSALGFAYKVIVAAGTAFVTFRMRAVAELMIIWRAAYELGNLFKALANFLTTGRWEIPADQFERWEDQVKRVTGDILRLGKAGAESLEEALGIDVRIPTIDDLLGGLKKMALDVDVALRPAKDDVATLRQEMLDMRRAARGGAEAITEDAYATRDWSDYLNSAAAAADNAKGKADELTVSIGEQVRALVAVHPATIAAAAAVEYWKSQIESVNLAIVANRDQLRAAQDEYDRMQEQLSGMNERLSELQRQLSAAQQRLNELARPRLRGMGEIESQIAAVQRQIQRVQLAQKLRIPLEQIIQQYPELEAGAAAYLATLPKTEVGLQQVLEQLQLMKSLKYDEQLDALAKAAEGATEELDFTQAMRQIQDTRSQIDSLTSAISAQESAIRAHEGAMKAQQQVIKEIQRAGEDLNRTLAEYQKQLEQAQINQDLLTQALQLAFTWLLEDRQKFMEMGGEAADQAAVVDEKVRALLLAVSGFVGDTTASGTTSIQTMRAAYAEAVGAINSLLASIPREVTTTHTIITRYQTEGAPSEPEGRQAGGSVLARRLYLVGERGPELFVPRASGAIVPAGRTRELLGATRGRAQIVVQFGDVYVHDREDIEILAYRVAETIQRRRR